MLQQTMVTQEAACLCCNTLEGACLLLHMGVACLLAQAIVIQEAACLLQCTGGYLFASTHWRLLVCC